MLDNELFDLITDGNVAYELCRPIRLYDSWFMRNLAMRMSRAILRCIPILLVAAFLPQPFKASPPASAGMLMAFFISLALGLFVTVAFVMLVYGLTFYTVSSQGIRMVSTLGVEFLSGGVVPIPFFPDSIRSVIEIMPFASMQNTPFLIYSGSLSPHELMRAMALQVMWLFILVLLGHLLYRDASRRIVLQGG